MSAFRREERNMQGMRMQSEKDVGGFGEQNRDGDRALPEGEVVGGQQVLLLGATGYIGSHVGHALSKRQFLVDQWGRATFDLLSPPEHETWSELAGWTQSIVNCAGFADMDRAEHDHEYALQMDMVNHVFPVWLRRNRQGYLAQISSPLVLFENRGIYARQKRAMDHRLRTDACTLDDTLLIYPGWLYGGQDSPQIDGILRKGLDKPLVLDNIRIGNPTPIEWFAAEVARLVEERRTGRWLIYGEASMTAARFAREILGIWGERWTEGEYVDAAPRPRDWRLNDQPGHHVTLRAERLTDYV